MIFKKLLGILNLHRFEGGTAGAAAGSGEGAAAMGETKGAVPGATRRGTNSGETQKVIYGKQTTAGASDHVAGGSESGEKSAPDAQGGKDFDALINGEYKDAFAEKVQKILNDRFKGQKAMETQLAESQKVLDMMYDKYGVQDRSPKSLTEAINSDPRFFDYLEDKADEAGMTVDQYREYETLKRQNDEYARSEYARQKMMGWVQEAQQLVGTQEAPGEYPNFDLRGEMQNPAFRKMLENGFTMKNAYESIHHAELIEMAKKNAIAASEKQMADNIRAVGSRPDENGSSSQSAFVIKSDPSKWTKEDRKRVRDLVHQGKHIEL